MDANLALAPRPIKIVCAYPAGGLADTLARVYGEYLSQKLGQPVIVENKAGASGSIAAAAVKQSPPDGYTLLLAITATLVQSRVLFKTLPYDADKDFALHFQHVGRISAIGRL